MPEPSVLSPDTAIAGPPRPRIRRRSRQQGRAQRWDAGPVPTARDLAALRFVGEQYAVRARRARGPAGPAVPRHGPGAGIARAEDACASGSGAGSRPAGPSGAACSATPGCCRPGPACGWPGWSLTPGSRPSRGWPTTTPPRVVRLHREPLPGQGGWVCERELWRRRGKAALAPGRRRPARAGPGRAGRGSSEAWELVEVELTQKARPRRGGRAQDPAAAHRRHHLLRPRRPPCAAVGAARQRGAGAGRPPRGRAWSRSRRCPASPTCRPGVMPRELASRGPTELGRLGAARSPLGPPPAHLGLGASRPAAVRQPARPPPPHRRPTRRRPAHHGRRPGPVPAQPGHPAGLGRRPSIAAHHRPALVEARPRLPGRHRRGDRWSRVARGRPWPSTSPATRAGCARSAPPSSTTRRPGRSCGPSSPWPSRSACWPPRSTWPAAARPSTRPRSSSSSARPPAAWRRPSAAPPACATTTSAPSPSASRSTATSAGPTSTAWSSSPGSCRTAPG